MAVVGGAAALAAATGAPSPNGLSMDDILHAGASVASDGEEECHSHLQSLLQTAYHYLCHFSSEYGTQVLVLAVLVALAAFRREMSCNRVFHDMEGAAERRGSSAVHGWAKAEDDDDDDDNDDVEDDDDGDDDDDVQDSSDRNDGSDDDDKIDDLLDGAALLSRPLVAIWDVAADTAKEGMELVVSSSAASASASSLSRDGGATVAAAITSGKIDAHQLKAKSGAAAAAMKLPTVQTSPLLHLSADTTVHILIYLHPRDITSGFGCAAKATRSLVDDELSTGLTASKNHLKAMPRRSSSHSVSVMLWKQLWWRDYGHALSRWDIGRQAMKRSVGARIDGDDDDDSSSPSNNAAAIIKNCKRITSPAYRHLESSLTEAKICVDTADDPSVGRRKSVGSSLPPTQRMGQLKDDQLKDDRDYDNSGSRNSSEDSSGNSNDGATADFFLSNRSRSTMKNLYFSFAAGWVDYTLAGQNTFERCLVGLHGHVFDISDFVEGHPGSPETLIVQSGRDATAFFEDLGHSLGARKIALSMCAVMDRSCAEQRPMSNNSNIIIHRPSPASPLGSSCGLCLPGPGGNGAVPCRSDVAASRALAAKATGSMPMGRSKPRRAGCLQRIREDLHKGRVKAQVCADKWAASVGNGTALENGMLGSVRVYWDPLRGEWLAWYTNINFQSVFLASDVTRFGAK